MIANIDFETRSTIDLKATGVYPYAAHPSTDVWVLAVAYGDEEPEIWCPQAPELFPGSRLVADRLACHIVDGGELHAWNANFERIVWKYIMTPRYKFPEPALDQFFCTMAKAAAYGLPQSLDHAAEVLGVEEQKDKEGKALMMRMTRPRSKAGDPLVWWTDEEKILRLAEYCKQDIRTERAIGKKIEPLIPSERALYLLDQKINDRGVFLDVPLAQAAVKVAEIAMEKANADMVKVTDGRVLAVTQVIELTKWVQEQGVACTSIAKEPLAAMLADPGLPADVRTALEIRSESGKSSVAKVEKMLDYASLDGFMRGMLAFLGAGTGRWAGRGPQPQNFPRGTIPGIECILDWILRCDLGALNLVASIMDILSSALRSFMRAKPGHQLYVADFSAIEARVLPWLAGQHDLLKQFQDYDAAKAKGVKVKDPYEIMAAMIYGLRENEKVSKDQRFLGKIAILQLGFGAGHIGFQNSCAGYGVHIQRYGVADYAEIEERAAADRARNDGELSPYMVELLLDARRYRDSAKDEVSAYGIVRTYRKKYQEIVAFWYALEKQFKAVVKRVPSSTETCIEFTRDADWVFCTLPSGRTLKYAKPRLVPKEDAKGKVTEHVRIQGFNGMTRKWESQAPYGGLFAENFTQAVARDLMAEAMVRVENAGYSVILTVHDEVVSEAPDTMGSVTQFEALMCVVPAWAAGCPVAAEAWTGLRYKK